MSCLVNNTCYKFKPNLLSIFGLTLAFFAIAPVNSCGFRNNKIGLLRFPQKKACVFKIYAFFAKMGRAVCDIRKIYQIYETRAGGVIYIYSK